MRKNGEDAVVSTLDDSRWSQLPKDILEQILKRLVLADYIRFGAVCVSWRSVMAEKRHPPAPQIPWIMLRKDGEGIHNWDKLKSWNRQLESWKYETFYSPSEGRLYSLIVLPLTSCCGSSGSWMVMSTESGKNFLVNPFSGVQIPLPNLFIRKAILLSVPNSGGSGMLSDCVIVAMVKHRSVAFCRLGDATWTTLIEAETCLYEDVIFHKGQLYAVTSTGQLKLCILSPSPQTKNFLSPIETENPFQPYLVESCGELLVLLKPTSRGERFQIFKLDTSAHCLVSVHSLGEQMLFIGYNGAMSLAAPGFFGDGGDLFGDEGNLLRGAGDRIGFFCLARRENNRIFPLNRVTWSLRVNGHLFQFKLTDICVTPSLW